MFKTYIGLSILANPGGFKDSGLIGGVIGIAIVGAL